jgi:acetoin utilization protein AcuB
MTQIRELMHTPVYTVAPGDSLRKAVREMNDHHVRQLPVAENGRLVGMLTDRDIRLHVVYLEDRTESGDSFNDALDTLVEEVMTRDVKVLHPWQTIVEALDLFISEKFGGAPVVEGEEQLVGILTYIDLLAELKRLLKH